MLAFDVLCVVAHACDGSLLHRQLLASHGLTVEDAEQWLSKLAETDGEALIAEVVGGVTEGIGATVSELLQLPAS